MASNTFAYDKLLNRDVLKEILFLNISFTDSFLGINKNTPCIHPLNKEMLTNFTFLRKESNLIERQETAKVEAKGSFTAVIST